MGEAERGEAAPRQTVTYFCAREHRSVVPFSTEAQIPESWDCPKCGLPAGRDSENAQEVCGAIRARIREVHGDGAADAVRVLYGGSVKAANVGGICRFYDMPVL